VTFYRVTRKSFKVCPVPWVDSRNNDCDDGVGISVQRYTPFNISTGTTMLVFALLFVLVFYIDTRT
jgi:hypothetical protein